MSEVITMTKEEALARGCMYVPVIKAELTLEASKGVEYITPLGHSNKIVLQGNNEGYTDLCYRLFECMTPDVAPKDNDMDNDQAVEEYLNYGLYEMMRDWIIKMAKDMKNNSRLSISDEIMFTTETFELKYIIKLEIVEFTIFSKNTAAKMMVIPE